MREMTARRMARQLAPPRGSVACLLLMGALALFGASDAASQTSSDTLAPPESFAGIADQQKRSAAIFTELGKVLTHPRCVNCHPVGNSPRQTDQRRLHQPPVQRGADGFGAEPTRCFVCHGPSNFEPAHMPGHPQWHLAPVEMAWEGKSISQICAQIKDPQRNGGRRPEDLIDHIGGDSLVGWGWAPGSGREPVPGTQKIAGALVEAWVQTGAACP
jgi:hypothetical protein